MKFKEILVLAVAATSLVACSKEETPQPKEQNVEVRDSLDWTFDFSTPWNNINLNNLHPYKILKTNGWHDEQVGNVFYFKTDQYDFTVIYFWNTFEGEDIRVTGNLNGHPFIMSNCRFNMCNGPSGVVMTYTLKDYTGAVKSTCTATNS